jgi:hypothetical protein
MYPISNAAVHLGYLWVARANEVRQYSAEDDTRLKEENLFSFPYDVKRFTNSGPLLQIDLVGGAQYLILGGPSPATFVSQAV